MKQNNNEGIERELKDLKLSKEVYEEAKSIVLGERGLMPIISNKIEIVWVHPSGYGRKAILNVTKEGKEEFEKVMEICKKNYDNKRLGSQSKEKEMLKKINGFLEENKVDNRKEFCYKFTSEAWNTFLHKEELHPNWLIKQKLKGAEQ